MAPRIRMLSGVSQRERLLFKPPQIILVCGVVATGGLRFRQVVAGARQLLRNLSDGGARNIRSLGRLSLRSLDVVAVTGCGRQWPSR